MRKKIKHAFIKTMIINSRHIINGVRFTDGMHQDTIFQTITVLLANNPDWESLV